MKNILINSSVFYAFIYLVSCSGAGAQEKITNNQLKDMLENDDVQILDVRTPEEVSFGVIKGATVIDFYDPDFSTKVNTLDKEKPVVVYCAAGGRSAQAVRKLKVQGFTKTHDLSGGFRSWKTEGNPIEKR